MVVDSVAVDQTVLVATPITPVTERTGVGFCPSLSDSV
jgi:hypothetical protein